MNNIKHSSHRTSDNALLWAFFALVIYAPLPLASNRPWALALLGGLVSLLLLWHMWSASDQSMGRAFKIARFPLGGLMLWMSLLLLQIVPLPDFLRNMSGSYSSGTFYSDGSGVHTLTMDLYSSRLYFVKACILSVVFWLLVCLVNSRQRIELLAKIIILSGLIQALVGVVLMATGTTFQLFFVSMDNPRAHGTFVSPDHFAGYLEMTLAVGIGLMIAKLDGRSVINWRKRLHGWLTLLISGKAMLRLTLIIMVVGLVASRSRMGNAAFFSSLLIVGIFSVIFSKHAARTTVIFITSLIVLDVVIIGGVVGVEKVVERIQNTNMQTQAMEAPQSVTSQSNVKAPDVKAHAVHVLTQEESLEQRSLAGRYGTQVFLDYPVLGTGGGTFYQAFPHYMPGFLSGVWEHAHNDYIEFASEAGALGVLVLAALVMHSIWCSVRLLVNSRDQLARGMAFAGLMGIVSLLIHAAVDFNFQIPANAMLFLMVLGLPYLINGLKH